MIKRKGTTMIALAHPWAPRNKNIHVQIALAHPGNCSCVTLTPAIPGGRKAPRNKNIHVQKGFTLIEMMIVAALISILASFAVPAYQDKIRKARRADGIAALSGLQLSMEKFRGGCAFFPSEVAGADACGANSAASDIEYPFASGEGYYTISIVASASTGNAFKIEADPTGTQAVDTDCDPMSITVNNANPKGLKAPTSCWK